MKTRTIIVLLSCLALTFFLYVTPSANAASAEEEVLQVAQNFDKAMNDNDLNLMSSLWSHTQETSFFGPGKNEAFITCGWDKVEAFFKSMFEMPPGEASFSSYNPQATILSDKVAIVTEYCILTGNSLDTNEQFVMQMRASIMLEKVNEKWLIVHGHWSTFPTE